MVFWTLSGEKLDYRARPKLMHSGPSPNDGRSDDDRIVEDSHSGHPVDHLMLVLEDCTVAVETVWQRVAQILHQILTELPFRNYSALPHRVDFASETS